MTNQPNPGVKCERCGLINPTLDRWEKPFCTTINEKTGNTVVHERHQIASDTKPSPTSTEEWEKNIKNIFNDLRKESTNIDYSEKYILDIFRSHDQQLRQRIVAEINGIVSIVLQAECKGADKDEIVSALETLITNL